MCSSVQYLIFILHHMEKMSSPVNINLDLISVLNVLNLAFIKSLIMFYIFTSVCSRNISTTALNEHLRN